MLGSVMLYAQSIEELVDIRFLPIMFYRSAHRRIYEAMLKLWEKKEPIDLVTLSEQLKIMKTLDECGGAYYLTELSETEPSSTNIVYHAKIVRDRHLKRKLIEDCANITRNAFENQIPLEELLDQASRISILDQTEPDSIPSMDDVMGKVFHRYQETADLDGALTGVDTTIPALNQLTCGLQNKELIILAGRTSHGKTTLALQICRKLALEEKKAVGFFTIEMDDTQLGQKLVAQEAGVDQFRLRHGRLNEEEVNLMYANATKLSQTKILIDDRARMTKEDITKQSRRWKKEYGKELRLIIIDQLDLVRLPGKDNSRKDSEMGDVTKEMKALAKELDLPVLLLHQIGRSSEKQNRRPILSDLKNSGDVEQDADTVIFLFSPHFNKNNASDSDAAQSEIIVAKQRMGPRETVPAVFNKKKGLFLPQSQYDDF